jgi:hypothetical protein
MQRVNSAIAGQYGRIDGTAIIQSVGKLVGLIARAHAPPKPAGILTSEEEFELFQRTEGC